MSVFATRARLLADRLLSLTTQVREIRALVLVDRLGLVLVSTLHARGLEEALGAFAAGVGDLLRRAAEDFQMGPLHLLHLAGRGRQLMMTPVTAEVSLVALVEAGAASTAVELHVLAMAREILDLLQQPVALPEGNE